jgi:hypothetical protein
MPERRRVLALPGNARMLLRRLAKGAIISCSCN